MTGTELLTDRNGRLTATIADVGPVASLATLLDVPWDRARWRG